ncbi:MAG: hypothetical protein SWY16_14800 [Cyanobacteriota bacterium]|nr:hypothetical protein [Cyanobacteriota bacterium]
MVAGVETTDLSGEDKPEERALSSYLHHSQSESLQSYQAKLGEATG